MFFNLLSFGSPGIFLKSTFFGFKGPQETKADAKLSKNNEITSNKNFSLKFVDFHNLVLKFHYHIKIIH